MLYKSNLVGYLTFPSKQEIPRNFRQLYDHKEFTINLMAFSRLELDILKSSPTYVFRGIVKRVKVTNSMETCLKSATNDHTACIIWKTIGTGEMMKYVSSFPPLKSLFISQDTATIVDVSGALKKHSIYYEIFNKYAGVAKESGLIDKWVKNSMLFEKELANHRTKHKNDKIDQNDEDNGQTKSHSTGSGKEKPLKVKNLVAIAYAFVFGCCVSFICLAMEFILKAISFFKNRVKMVVQIKIID